MTIIIDIVLKNVTMHYLLLFTTSSLWLIPVYVTYHYYAQTYGNTSQIVASMVSAAALLSVISRCCFFRRRKKKKTRQT